MKTFLRKIIQSLVVFSAFALLIGYVLNLVMEKKVDRMLHIPENTETIILGDSHAECSFVQEEDFRFKNYGSSGEGVYYTKLKFNKLLTDPNFDKLKNIIISIGPHSIAPNYEQQNLESFSSFDRDWPILGLNDIFQLSIPQGDKILLAIRKLAGVWSIDGVEPFFMSEKFMGGTTGWSDTTHVNEKNLKKTLDRQYGNNKIFGQTSRVLMDDFKYIIDKSSELNKRVYIINTPVHSIYAKAIPNKSQQAYSNFIACITKGKNEVEFYDFSQIELPSELYFDVDHLNPKGAKIFTEHFFKVIKKEIPYAYSHSEITNMLLNTRHD